MVEWICIQISEMTRRRKGIQEWERTPVHVSFLYRQRKKKQLVVVKEKGIKTVYVPYSLRNGVKHAVRSNLFLRSDVFKSKLNLLEQHWKNISIHNCYVCHFEFVC